MKRRRYVSGMLAGATPLLAGCSGGGDSTPTEVPLDPDESGEFEDRIAPHTDAALSAFEEVVELLRTEAAAFDALAPGEVDHQVEETASKVDARLGDAKEELKAAGNAGYAYRYRWYVYGFTEFRKWLGDFVPILTDAVEAYDGWTATHSRWADEEFEAAGEKAEVARNGPTSEKLLDPWTLPEDTANWNDEFDLAAFDQFATWEEDLRGSFSSLLEWGGALHATARGVWMFAEGMDRYLMSVDRYQGEKWQHGTNYAESTAISARDKFAEAETHLRDEEGRIPSEFGETFSTYVCYAEAMVEAADLRREAALAAENGDSGTASSKVTEAERARERCPFV